METSALKAIFKRLVAEKILSDNPATGIKRLARNERKFHVVTKEEEKIYLLACPQPLQNVAAPMLETGMRPSEIYNLTRHKVFIEKGGLQVENSKTKSSTRKIWLPDKAMDILRRRLKQFTGELLFQKHDVDGGAVIINLRELHSAALDRTKFKFRLYDCRHIFAARILENGADLLTLASMLGYADLVEASRYARLLLIFLSGEIFARSFGKPGDEKPLKNDKKRNKNRYKFVS